MLPELKTWALSRGLKDTDVFKMISSAFVKMNTLNAFFASNAGGLMVICLWDASSTQEEGELWKQEGEVRVRQELAAFTSFQKKENLSIKEVEKSPSVVSINLRPAI